MTFLSSWRLVFLVAPAVLLVAYLLAQRARHKVAARFTSVDLLASVAPRRPGWQRHLSAAGLLAALIIFVLAFAQPARVVSTPRQRATVILTLDTSGSMIANDVTPSRLAAAQEAARSFAKALPHGVQLGLVSFATNADLLVAPTGNRSAVLAAINSLQAGGGTATADAIDLSLKAIHDVPATKGGKRPPGTIVLMSDGSPTIGQGDLSPMAAVDHAANAAKAAHVKINTIAFGTQDGTVTVHGQTVPVPADPAAMAQIASISGGHTFSATTVSQLKSVYQEIGRVVGYQSHREEITAWFVGIALVFAVGAAVAALIWTQRIV